MEYDFDLETTPLQIKTDSARESFGLLFGLLFFTAEGKESGSVFIGNPNYVIYPCSTKWTALPQNLIPAEQNKIWTITETATSVKIECNEVEVLTYTFTDSSMSEECATGWSRDTTKIKFKLSANTNKVPDTASDEFRPKPGTWCWELAN